MIGQGESELNQPLCGFTVVCTRPESQCAPVVEAVRRQGGEPLVMPLITTITRAEPEVARFAHNLRAYDAIVVTSANGIRAFADVCTAESITFANVAPICYAIGQATAESVRQHGGRVTNVPAVKSGAELGLRFVEVFQGRSSQRVLCLQGQLAEDTLATTLRKAGHQVDVCICYETREVDADLSEWQPVLGSWNAIVMLFSPSAAKSLARQCEHWLTSHQCLSAFVCIGQSTADACRRLMLPVSGVAAEPTAESLMQKLVQIARERRVPK